MGRPGTFQKNYDSRRNLAGRPKKGDTLTDILFKELNKRRLEDEAKGGTEKDTKTRKIAAKKLIAKKLVDLALADNVQALKYIFDRIDGQPRQALEFHAEQPNIIPADFEERQTFANELDRRLNLDIEP